MQVAYVILDGDETASVIIARSEFDIVGDGRVAYLSPQMTSLLTPWILKACLEAGPLFRGLHVNRPSDSPLATSFIRRLIKSATVRAGLDASIANELSGHSMRIGAAQDMMVVGFGALAIMQAGGWKSAKGMLPYVQNAVAKDLHSRRWLHLKASQINVPDHAQTTNRSRYSENSFCYLPEEASVMLEVIFVKLQ